MNGNSSYYFERLSDKNFAQFYKLHCRVFNSKKNIELLKRKYDTREIIEGYWGYLAFDKDTNEPVSYFGALPWLIEYKHIVYRVAQGVDIMTLPEHRGKGIILSLHELITSLLKGNNFCFLFAFANQSSLPIVSKKFQWQIHGGLQHCHHQTGLKWSLRKVAYKIPILKSIHDSWIDKIFSPIEIQFHNELFKGKGRSGTLKNSTFYERKLFHDKKLIRIEDSVFLLKITNHFSIGDFHTQSPAEFQKHLNTLISLVKKCGITYIHFLTNSEPLIEILSPCFTPSGNVLALVVKEFQKTEINYDELVFTTTDLDTF